MYMYTYILSTVYVHERGRYVERNISSKFAPFPDRAKCIGTDLYDCCCDDLSSPTCTTPPPAWLFGWDHIGYRHNNKLGSCVCAGCVLSTGIKKKYTVLVIKTDKRKLDSNNNNNNNKKQIEIDLKFHIE